MKWLTSIMDKDSAFRIYEVEVDNLSQFKVINIILQWQVLGSDTQLSHFAIANRLGLARSTVSIAIKKLVKSGILEIDPGFLPTKREKSYKVVGVNYYR